MPLRWLDQMVHSLTSPVRALRWLLLGSGLLALVALQPVARAQDAPRVGRDGGAPSPTWDWGVEVTSITQFAPSFTSPYEGPNSFKNEGSGKPATTFITTLFTAVRLWEGAWVSVQPEFSDGSGVGGATGIASYPNQDVLRVPTIAGRPYLGRAFVQQAIPLGEATEAREPSLGAEERFLPGGNHLFGLGGRPRLELTFGKVSLPDFFDASDFGRDGHHGVMSWALVSNGAWDYAADTRGYTWGFTAAYEGGPVAVRAGTFAMPEIANGRAIDHDFSHAHAENLEVEWDFDPQNEGAVRLLGFVNHARMGSYEESLALAQANQEAPDITASRRRGRVKYGFGLNAQRRLTPDLGVFGRLGWNDGRTETFAFTEIDRTALLGLSHTGSPWKRPNDRVILALLASGLSGPHRRYLESGGLGFQLGDGQLRYGPEIVAELQYAAEVTAGVSLGLDGQVIVNPGYNRDRGPVKVLGLRVHIHR